MWRTALLLLSLILLTPPLAAGGEETGRVYRIGWLAAFASSDPRSSYDVEFVHGLKQTGWVEGQHFVLEHRAARQPGSLPALAAELVRQKVDVIVAEDQRAARAAKQATETIPIVFALVDDPVGAGLVASLRHPGGNATGVASVFPELGSKLLELLKETVPGLATVAVLWDPSDSGASATFRQIEQAAQVVGLGLHLFPAGEHPAFDAAMSALAGRRPDGLIVLYSRLISRSYERIRYIVRTQRLPAISNDAFLAHNDLLLAYGPSQEASFQRAAHYVRQILEGAKPSTLPVERPTQFDLVVNLRSAAALGITFPNSVLVRATTVLE